MKRTFCLLLGVTACAPSAGPPLRAPATDVVTISAADGTMEGELRLTREDYVAEDVLPADRATVWEELPGAFVDVALPYPQLDADGWSALVRNHLAVRRLGKRRLSTLFDCGRGAAGPYADSYRLYVTVTTEVVAAGDDETAVHTRVEAMAQSTSGLSGTVTCSSRGGLEDALAEAILLRIAKRAGGA